MKPFTSNHPLSHRLAAASILMLAAGSHAASLSTASKYSVRSTVQVQPKATLKTTVKPTATRSVDLSKVKVRDSDTNLDRYGVKQNEDYPYVFRDACAAGYCLAKDLLKTNDRFAIDKVNYHDLYFTNGEMKYLTKGGPLVPQVEPEYGESGYYDTYYGRVDPSGERATFASFKTVNGFDNYSYAVARARYINAYDLGFGRDMNCLDNACYVTNYQDPKGANTLAVTVAMERRWRSGTTYIAFYVYDAAGNRINYAPLDTEGNKAVPYSCFACHKGYIAPSGNPYGGSFLPFDINLFENWPGKPTIASQLDDLRRLNYMVWSDTNTPDGLGGKRNADIAEEIEDWYGGAPFYGTSYSEYGHPPNEWFSQVKSSGTPVNGSGVAQNCATSPMPHACKLYFYERSLYANVYIKYCRSCHMAQGPVQDTSPSSQGVVFKTAALFGTYGKNAACSGAKSMPHAELTDERFRTDVLNFTNGTSKTPEEVLCNTPAP